MWIQASNLARILFWKKHGPLKIQDGCRYSKWPPSRTWNSWAPYCIHMCKVFAHMDTYVQKPCTYGYKHKNWQDCLCDLGAPELKNHAGPQNFPPFSKMAAMLENGGYFCTNTCFTTEIRVVSQIRWFRYWIPCFYHENFKFRTGMPEYGLLVAVFAQCVRSYA